MLIIDNPETVGDRIRYFSFPRDQVSSENVKVASATGEDPESGTGCASNGGWRPHNHLLGWNATLNLAGRLAEQGSPA